MNFQTHRVPLKNLHWAIFYDVDCLMYLTHVVEYVKNAQLRSVRSLYGYALTLLRTRTKVVYRNERKVYHLYFRPVVVAVLRASSMTREY